MSDHKDHTQDDARFERFLRSAAASYNEPPAVVPREAMWEAIQRARRAETPAPVVRALPRRGFPVRWWSAAAAAALLVALSYAAGRRSASADHERVATAPATTTAPELTPAPVSTGERTVATKDDEAAPEARHATRAGSSRLAVGPRPSALGSAVRPSPLASRADLPYQLATVRHLTEVEALLTEFRADGADARADAQLAAWARRLLADTRLLLDSPAARDPLRRKLLEDLELVLVQMAQLAPSPEGSTVRDRDLIQGTIDQEQVMPRLRTAIPAGYTVGT